MLAAKPEPLVHTWKNGCDNAFIEVVLLLLLSSRKIMAKHATVHGMSGTGS